MLLDTILNPRGLTALSPSPSDDYWYNPVGLSSAAGIRVDERTALNYSAVWAATRLIAETVARLPLVLYQHTSTGGKTRANQHPVYRLLKNAPNREMTNMAFREICTARAVNWGNGYAEIERTAGGRPVALWPIHPSRIYVSDVKRDEKTGEIIYLVRNDLGGKTPIRASDMLHVPGSNSEDGIFGRGVIRHARETVGWGMAMTRYGAGFFGNGARPGGVLEHPAKLSETANKNLRDSWNRVHQGPGSGHNIAILEEGMKYHAIDIPPEEAQFLQSQKFGITEIARWYGLPPHKLADLERATHSNIEMEAIAFVEALLPWMTRWDQEIHKKLLTEAEQEKYFSEHLVQDLLRADARARAEFVKAMFQVGAMSPNDALRAEYMDPIGSEGDERFVPMNMMPLSKAVELATAMVKNKGAGDPDEEGGNDETAEDGDGQSGGEGNDTGDDAADSKRKSKKKKAKRKKPEEDPTEPQQFDFKGAMESFAQPMTATIQALRATYDAMLEEREKQQEEWQRRELDRLQAVIADAELAKDMSNDEVLKLAEESRQKQAAWNLEVAEHRKREAFSAGRADALKAKIVESETALAGYAARQGRQRLAAREVLRHEVQRFITREANEARRAAKKPREFLTWLDSFYGTHVTYFQRDLKPAVTAWLTATDSNKDVDTTISEIVGQHVTMSRHALLSAADGDPEAFVDRVETTVGKWEKERAMEVVG